MKKAYESPVIIIDNNLSEGVYLASGAQDTVASSSSSEVTAKITSEPVNSWDPYQVSVVYANSKNESPAKFSIKFNQTINNAWGANGTISGTGSDTLSFEIWGSNTISFTLNVVAGPSLQVLQ